MDESVSGKVVNAEVPLAEMFGYADFDQQRKGGNFYYGI